VSVGAPGAAPLRGVLFDIDDTLVDTASAFAAGLVQAVSSLVALSPAEHEEVVALWRADAGGHYRRYVAGETDLVGQRRARTLELTTHLGLPALDDPGFARWDETYRQGVEAGWALFDDAHDAVARAVAAGLAVGALTNAPQELQLAKVAAVGLADVLPVLVAVDTLGVGKPDPRVFHEACRRLGTDPGETLYVGDELDVDARAAVTAGLQGVWLDRPGRRREGPHAVTGDDVARAQAQGVRVVRSLGELADTWRHAPES
jgi:putative hydrolase of the HAD superfamily